MTDATAAAPMQLDNDLQERVMKQLEFYFGDSNMGRDRFLKQKMDSDPNGYVDIDILCTFNKLKEITTDKDLIVRAAKASSVLKVDETNKRVTRAKPVPVVVNVDAKTVYVELFPIESTREDLQKIFSNTGSVTYISIPKNTDGTSKRFAFIEYEKEEEAVAAVKKLNTIGNPEHLPVAPKGMRVMSKDTWYRLKDEFRELLNRVKDNTFNAAPEPGLIIFFGNVGPGVTSKDIKTALKKFAPIAYIDFDESKRTGYARFKQARGAQAAVQKIQDTKFTLGENEIICRIVTGSEEQQYWNKIHELAAKKKTESENNPKPNKFNKNQPKNNTNKKHENGKVDSNNNNNTNNENDNENSKESKKHPLQGGEDITQNKKQKKDSKDVKFKGKKIPSISKAKPKSHVFFGDDDGEDNKDTTNEKESQEQSQATNNDSTQDAGARKRPAENEEQNDTKRSKVELDNK